MDTDATGTHATASTRSCERSISRGWPGGSPPNCLEESGSAWPWRARWRRDPRLILLDEPLAALDLPLRDPMRQELRQFLRSIDVPSVVVTHDRVDALTLGDRMAVLSGGYIRQVGPVHEVFSRPVDLAVAASVGVETVVPGEIVESADGLMTVRVGASHIRVAQAAVVAGRCSSASAPRT